MGSLNSCPNCGRRAQNQCHRTGFLSINVKNAVKSIASNAAVQLVLLVVQPVIQILTKFMPDDHRQ